MDKNYNVSNMEIRQYLANKRIAYQKAIEQIDAALTLFEEAEYEVTKAEAFKDVNIKLDLTPIKERIQQSVDRAKQVPVGVGTLPEKFKGFDLTKVEDETDVEIMSVKEFLKSIKKIRLEAGKSQKEIASVIGLGQKGYDYVEQRLVGKGEICSEKTRQYVIKLAAFFNIKLPDEFMVGGWSKHPVKPKKLRSTKPIRIETTNTTTAGVPIKSVYKKRNREPAQDDESA